MTRFNDETITIARLVSFSDGVFAIAVTLLVFNLKIPQLPVDAVHQGLAHAIFKMAPNFLTYLFTFLVIATYWIFHHRMLNLADRIDKTFLWLNIWYLLMISFTPFPAALLGTYPDETFAFVFYISSMVLVCGLSMLMLGYAAYKSRLIKKEIPLPLIKYLYYRQFTSVLVFLAAVPLALLHFPWTKSYLFILFPVHQVTKKYFRKVAEGTA
jgi:uncharacterized membrane protein